MVGVVDIITTTVASNLGAVMSESDFAQVIIIPSILTVPQATVTIFTAAATTNGFVDTSIIIVVVVAAAARSAATNSTAAATVAAIAAVATTPGVASCIIFFAVVVASVAVSVGKCSERSQSLGHCKHLSNCDRGWP